MRSKNRRMGVEIVSMERHRNGISGAPFYAVLFRYRTDGEPTPGLGGANRSLMLATVFEEERHVAVLNVGKLIDGDVDFGSNSWRGDDFEAELRAAIEEREG